MPCRSVDELHARNVAPMEVFEHEQDWPDARLGIEPVFPCAPHLIAHQLGIVSRRLELHARPFEDGGSDDLCEKLGHARNLLRSDDASDARAELLATIRRGL